MSIATDRRHFSVSFRELGERLDVPGEIFRVWTDESVDYLHLLTFTQPRYEVDPGGYVDDEGSPIGPVTTVEVSDPDFGDVAVKAWTDAEGNIHTLARQQDSDGNGESGYHVIWGRSNARALCDALASHLSEGQGH